MQEINNVQIIKIKMSAISDEKSSKFLEDNHLLILLMYLESINNN